MFNQAENPNGWANIWPVYVTFELDERLPRAFYFILFNAEKNYFSQKVLETHLVENAGLI